MRKTIGLGLLAVFAAAITVIAQTDHNHAGGTMDHATHSASAAERSVLREPGQGAFAALSEVVRVLEADPETDWSRVDLAGLRGFRDDLGRNNIKAVSLDAVNAHFVLIARVFVLD